MSRSQNCHYAGEIFSLENNPGDLFMECAIYTVISTDLLNLISNINIRSNPQTSTCYSRRGLRPLVVGMRGRERCNGCAKKRQERRHISAVLECLQ